MARSGLLLILLGLILLVLLAWPGAALALPGWSVTARPLGSDELPRAAAAFGGAGVVVAGQGGRVAVSTDGGRTWRGIPAAALTSATLRAAAFVDAGRGVVVGDRATLLVGGRDDQGMFGWAAAAVPAALTTDLRDVTMRGTVGYAVGTRGVVLQTVDGGRTWRRESIAAGVTLRAVAMSADGQIVAAVGDAGTVAIKKGGSWTLPQRKTTANLLDVAVPADSRLDVVYCCSSLRVYSLQGTGAARLLAAQPKLPEGGVIRALSLIESRTRTRLVVGGSGGWLAGFVPGGSAWAKQAGGAPSTVTSFAAAGDGICYATAADGRVQRTLSGGAPFTLALKASPSASHPDHKAIITAGGSVLLGGSTSILAPGTLALQALPAGATSWRTIAFGAPGAVSMSDTESPTRTTGYRLRFLFAGGAAAIGPRLSVGVRHKVSVAATTFRLSLRDVYKVRGSVAPKASAGRTVEVWTDRAGDRRLGPWHRIRIGSAVPLSSESTFVTRAFGTPVRETYHLRIRMAKDDRHLTGWSPLITVTVR